MPAPRFVFTPERGMDLSPAQLQARTAFERKLKSDVYRLSPLSCPCGAADDELLADHERHGLAINCVICRRCGQIRADPYYDEDTLRRFYADEYDLIYARRAADFSTVFAARAAGIGRSTSSAAYDYGRRILDHIHGLRAISGRERVYELGCGGWNLWPFHAAGCRVCGTDYDEQLVTAGRGKGLDLRCGGAERLSDLPPPDIVILNHVLEHVRDPQAMLCAAVQLLAPDGLLYVAVPTIETIGIYNHNLFWYLVNAHCWHFSSHTLQRLLAQAGLSCLDLIRDHIALAVKDQDGGDEQDAQPESDYAYALAVLAREEEQYHLARVHTES